MSPTGGSFSGKVFLLFMCLYQGNVSAFRLNFDYNGTVVTTLPPHRVGKVLNFVSLPGSVSRECLSDDGRRSGVCLNNYECKIQEGVALGNCASGFGVCCVFTSSCGGSAYNNVTYFTNPEFPGLSYQSDSCYFRIKKISPHISQIRLDLIHFNLAQPNRRTAVCDTDILSMEMGGYSEFKLCGFNSGQHFYFDVEGEPGLDLVLNMTKNDVGRLWEIKITQIEFRNRAPSGCLQYFFKPSGVVQTMNYAINGRHLAEQDYTICIRQGAGMCSITYEPCDENSFRIGPASSMQILQDDEGSGFGEVASRTDECDDRIVIPCDSEEFLTPRESIPGICDLLHCGSSFCTPGEFPCRIESSIAPFNIHVQFGVAPPNESPDDNLGMCLKYQQQPCS